MIQIIKCDFTNPQHCENLVGLINYYMLDPMGGGQALPEGLKNSLIEGLASHPTCFVLFAVHDHQFIGLTTCFINFSTFKAKGYINVHDLIVKREYRGQGIGRQLLEKVVDIAQEHNYCKVTLEVRDDNTNAKGLYHSLGFEECEPVMHFWTKML